MADVPVLAVFHFLRPWWLLVLPITILLYLDLARRARAAASFEGLIAPHLLEHLIVPGGLAEKIRPRHLITMLLALGGLAMSGPTWSREPSPFAADAAAIVVAVDVSTTMNAVDVQPTRLDRAKQKVRDLVALRPGARTGIVAYAGAAHVVLPPTDDPDVVTMYVDALDTTLMPLEGQRPGLALDAARELLARGDPSGSILFLTDGVPAEERPSFVRNSREGGPAVMLLALGTEAGGPIREGKASFATEPGGARRIARLDTASLDVLAKEADVDVLELTLDDGDVASVARKADRRLDQADDDADSVRWKDDGVFLVYPMLLIGALWFRRGWTVPWAALLLAFLVSSAAPAHAHDSTWADLWWTPDQQGRHHFEHGEFQAAAAHFENPSWKGVALARAGDLEGAADQFARLDTAEAYYNLGTTFARLERFEEAIAAYEAALRRRPEFPDATFNLDIARRLREIQRKKEEEEPAEGGDTLGADEIKEADPNDKRKRPEGEEQVIGGMMDEKMEEVWMRQVQTTPAAFLRAKFAIQMRDSATPSARKDEEEDG